MDIIVSTTLPSNIRFKQKKMIEVSNIPCRNLAIKANRTKFSTIFTKSIQLVCGSIL